MSTLEERIAKSKAQTAKLEEQRRIKMRKEREAKKKKDQRRNYIVGELVTQYFPQILNLEPGTKSENAVTFQPLKMFLSELAGDQKIVESLAKEINKNSIQNRH